MQPNPVRSLPSTAVVMNVPACTNMSREHEMVSQRLGDDTSVGFIEICRKCAWIDERSLQWWVEDAIKANMSNRAKRIAVAAESQPFRFAQQRGEALTLREILYQALGAASMCWESLDKAGTFNSTRAEEIGRALEAEVNTALAMVQTTPWSELAYELYALACNSTALEPKQVEEWQAAFERLKARFHELLEQAHPEEPDDSGRISGAENRMG